MNKNIIVSLAIASLLGPMGAMAVVEVNGSAATNANTGTSGAKANTQIQTEGSVEVMPTEGSGPQTSITIETKDGVVVNSERVLPTVNKKTGATVTVQGWDADKKQQIEARVQETLDTNPQITSAVVAEESVTINYSAPAKLFGFIPMNMNVNFVTDNSNRIKVRFPWYRFLVSTPFSTIAEEADAVLQANENNFATLRAQSSVDVQVQTFITLSNTLKASYDLALQKKP